jgi:predicted  nucleic acid-binding Zn-ribbon protein
MEAEAPFSINPNDLNPGQKYSSKAAVLRSNIKEEYCFYYKRYMFALQSVLHHAATKPADANYNQMKAKTEGLNSKLNQILQILQGIVKSRNESLKQYYGTGTGVNKLNTELDTNRAELVRHSKLIRDLNMEKSAKIAMVNYTVEKNNSSRNLLAIYGFMNIVAVGLLYYLYSSSRHE